LQYKSIDEETGHKILEWFQIDQMALAQTIFGVLPIAIAEQDQNMSQWIFASMSFACLKMH
jgi:hypothetical protein